MQAIGRLLSWMSTGSAILGAIAILLMMLQVSLDVLLKNLFVWPVPFTATLVTKWYMVAIAFLPLAMTEILDRNISVEVMFQRFNQRWQRIVGGAVCLFSAGMACIMVMPLWKEALLRMEAGSFVVENGQSISVWQTHFFLPVGIGLFALVLFYRVVVLWAGAASGLGEVSIIEEQMPSESSSSEGN